VDELELSVRAINILKDNHVATAAELFNLDSYSFCKHRGVGDNTLKEIISVMDLMVLDRAGKADLLPHIAECPSINVAPGYRVRLPLSPEVLDTPMASLSLSIRALSALDAHKIITVRQCLSHGVYDLLEIQNIGKKTVREIQSAINVFCAGGDRTKTETILQDALIIIFSNFSPASADIIKLRYGWEGKKLTLEAIGQQKGMTRERVRQISAKELQKVKRRIHNKALSDLINNYERLFECYGGVVSINDLMKDPYFNVVDIKQVRFVINLLADIYEDRYRLIDRYFYTRLDENEIEQLNEDIQEAIYANEFPIAESDFLDRIKKQVGNVSPYYLTHFLVNKLEVITHRGQVLSPGKLTLSKQLKLIMGKYRRPVHFSEMAKIYCEHYKGLQMLRTKEIERAIHSRSSNSGDFLLVGPGSFILREHFNMPSNWSTIVKGSRAVLESLKQATDTNYILKALHERGIKTGEINGYNLKSLLLDEPGFISCGKGIVGIEHLSDNYKKKSLAEWMYELIAASPTPLTLKEIAKVIGEQRIFPMYTISQQAGRDHRLIRVGRATYGIARHIPEYEAKKEAIINFASQWIKEKGRPLSSFLASEVLKATHELKDFPTGLVDHVLFNEPGFKCTATGFYEVAD